MIAIQTSITDSATPTLDRIAIEANAGEPRNKLIGASVNRLVKDHLVKKNSSSPNKLGGPRTNLFVQMSRSTNFRADNTSATVSINHVAAGQRYRGGTIHARRSKYLTIPLTPAAYNQRARGNRFADKLFAQHSKKGNLILFLKPRTKGDPIVPIYALKESVTQKPDPTVLPTDQEIQEAALKGARLHLDQVIRRGA